MVRFFLEGRCSYDFTLPEAGVYRGWLRYARKTGDGPFSITLDPQADAKKPRVTLYATGSNGGPGAWKWERLFEQTLTAGAHTLVLEHSGIRPDCVFISTGTQPPEITPGACHGVRVLLRGSAPPQRITNLVDAQTLTAHDSAGALEIGLPDFPILAVLQIEY